MPRGKSKTSPLLSLLHLLHRAGQRADGLFARHLGSDDFTPRQFMVLQAVAENEGLSQMDIMAATGIDRSSVADLVRRLVKQGLLRRRRQKRDTRLYAVRLTLEGKKALTLGVPAARATERDMLAAVQTDLHKHVLDALRAMASDGLK
jgi:MarR family transcriptional regulator, temperature-dependent positive regulator of motility